MKQPATNAELEHALSMAVLTCRILDNRLRAVEQHLIDQGATIPISPATSALIDQLNEMMEARQ